MEHLGPYFSSINLMVLRERSQVAIIQHTVMLKAHLTIPFPLSKHSVRFNRFTWTFFILSLLVTENWYVGHCLCWDFFLFIWIIALMFRFWIYEFDLAMIAEIQLLSNFWFPLMPWVLHDKHILWNLILLFYNVHSDIWNWWWIRNLCKGHSRLHNVECTCQNIQQHDLHVCGFTIPLSILERVKFSYFNFKFMHARDMYHIY